MTDSAKDRLGDAVDEMQERGKEAMQQHGDLGGSELENPAEDVLKSDPEEAEDAIDRMREGAVERKREADEAIDKMKSATDI